MRKSDLYELKIHEYKLDILKFVFEQFGVVPDEWQRKSLLAFANGDNKIFRISLQACAGPGKSALLSWCGWWFLLCMGEPGNHPKGVAISVTADNLKDNLWAELSKWQQISPMCMDLFKWTKTRIFAKSHPETWFLTARAFSRTSSVEEQGRTLSGIHSKYVLFLIDESGDIPPTILKSVDQAFSTADKVFGRVLQAGNPTSKDGMLYAAATTLAHEWHVVRITGDPDDSDRSPRIDIDWAKRQIETYGRNDPWVMSYILGQFPESAINTLLTLEDVQRAMDRHLRIDEYDFQQKRLGIDVAREGLDSTVIFPRQGLWVGKPVELRGADTIQVASRVAMAKAKWGSEVEFIDNTGGFGGGVIDNLRLGDHSPIGIHFASNADDNRYFNKRSEMWFKMAEAIKNGAALPNVPQLKKELTAVRYSFQNGKFRLEAKDQIKKRLSFSPDFSDALALTFAWPDMPSDTNIVGMTRAKRKAFTEEQYDPLSD